MERGALALDNSRACGALGLRSRRVASSASTFLSGAQLLRLERVSQCSGSLRRKIRCDPGMTQGVESLLSVSIRRADGTQCAAYHLSVQVQKVECQSNHFPEANLSMMRDDDINLLLIAATARMLGKRVIR